MTCLCKNPDGTFSQTCSGTCTQKEFKQSNYVEQRTEQAISDRFEYILRTFLDEVDERIKNLEMLCDLKYKEGFREGFEMGREIYE